jgi:hypothetical protein
MWFGGSKQSCSVATLKSLIRNMISGVINVSLLLKGVQTLFNDSLSDSIY